MHLLEGDPGTGKTTIALQFLLEGAARGETCLHVTLSETVDELRAVSQSHRWVLDGIHVYELTPSEGMLSPDEQYTLFHPSEVELSDTIKNVVEHVSRLNPSRVVIDSLAEMRLLASRAAALSAPDSRPQAVLRRPAAPGAHQLISVDQLDPAQVTPGEFATMIRGRVEQENARFVLIDSLNGYLSAMQDEAAVLQKQLIEMPQSCRDWSRTCWTSRGCRSDGFN